MLRKRIIASVGALLASAGLSLAQSPNVGTDWPFYGPVQPAYTPPAGNYYYFMPQVVPVSTMPVRPAFAWPMPDTVAQAAPAQPEAAPPPAAAAPAPAAPAAQRPTTAPVVADGCASCDTCRGCRLYAAAAATFFRARFDGTSGGGLGTGTSLNAPGIGINAQSTPSGGGLVDYERQTDGRFWLGFETPSGVGVRGRLSLYDNGSNPLTAQGSANVIGFPVTETDTSSTVLQMDVLDLDATYQLRAGNWGILGGVGIRYANLRRQTDMVQSSSTGIGAVQLGQTTVQNTDEEFDAWGPTVVLEARRDVLRRGFRGAGFVNLRASHLDDRTTVETSSATTSSTTVIGIITTTPPQLASGVFSRPTATTIFELEIGLEAGWQTPVGEFFCRASWEGQQWRHGGSVIGIPGLADHMYLTGWTVGGGWRF